MSIQPQIHVKDSGNSGKVIVIFIEWVFVFLLIATLLFPTLWTEMHVNFQLLAITLSILFAAFFATGK